MILSDLFGVFGENVDINVIDSNGRCIASYDGKNSIPEELNECEVYKIYPIDENRIDVEVYDVDSDEYMVESAINRSGVWSALNRF